MTTNWEMCTIIQPYAFVTLLGKIWQHEVLHNSRTRIYWELKLRKEKSHWLACIFRILHNNKVYTASLHVTNYNALQQC